MPRRRVRSKVEKKPLVFKQGGSGKVIKRNDGSTTLIQTYRQTKAKPEEKKTKIVDNSCNVTEGSDNSLSESVVEAKEDLSPSNTATGSPGNLST